MIKMTGETPAGKYEIKGLSREEKLNIIQDGLLDTAQCLMMKLRSRAMLESLTKEGKGGISAAKVSAAANAVRSCISSYFLIDNKAAADALDTNWAVNVQAFVPEYEDDAAEWGNGET